MGQSEYGKQPEVGRPRGAAWRALQNEGIVWEGQVTIPGEHQELAARLIVTQQRIVFVRGGGIALELDRSWLRAAPTMPTSGSVRLVVATSGEEGARAEALVVQPREGRIAASRLVAALTGGPRPALPLPPREQPVLEGQIRSVPRGSANAPTTTYPTIGATPPTTPSQTRTGQFAPGGPWGATSAASARPSGAAPPNQPVEPAPAGSGPVFGAIVPPRPAQPPQPTPTFGVRPASAATPTPTPPAPARSPEPPSEPRSTQPAPRPSAPTGVPSPAPWSKARETPTPVGTAGSESPAGTDPLKRLAERFGVSTSPSERVGEPSGHDPLNDVRPRTGSDQSRMLPGLPPVGPVLNPNRTGKDRSTSLRNLASRTEPRAAREWPFIPSEKDDISYGSPHSTLVGSALAGLPLAPKPGPVPASDSRSGASSGSGGSGDGSGGSSDSVSRWRWLRRRSVLWGTTAGLLVLLTAALGIYLVMGMPGGNDGDGGHNEENAAVASDDAALSVGTPAATEEAVTPTATIPRGIGGESTLPAPPASSGQASATETAAPREAALTTDDDVTAQATTETAEPEAAETPADDDGEATESANAGQDRATTAPTETPTEEATSTPTQEPTETSEPTATREPTNTPEPQIPTQPPSVMAEFPPSQAAVAGPFRYTIEAVSLGDSIPEISQGPSPYGGDWLALIVYAANWSDGEAILDMTQFTVDVTTGSGYQNYKLDGWSSVVAERLGITPALGATDQITLQPGEGVRIGLLFLVADNPVSTVLRIGQTAIDLEAAYNSSKSMLDLGEPPAAPDLVEATVTDVIDGQTIEVEIDGMTTLVRYLGVRAPTGNACYADEATAANEELVGGETVWIERQYAENDESGAWLRDVWVMGDAGSLILATEPLVSEGYLEATVERPDSRFAAYLETAEYIAMNEGRGFWGACGAGGVPADGAMVSTEMTTPVDVPANGAPTIAPMGGREAAA